MTFTPVLSTLAVRTLVLEVCVCGATMELSTLLLCLPQQELPTHGPSLSSHIYPQPNTPADMLSMSLTTYVQLDQGKSPLTFPFSISRQHFVHLTESINQSLGPAPISDGAFSSCRESDPGLHRAPEQWLQPFAPHRHMEMLSLPPWEETAL